MSYAYTKNSIENYNFLSDGVFNSTYANIGRYQWFNINGYMQWTVITDMQFSLYAGLNYEDYKASSPELKASRAGWSGNFNANFDYTLPCRLRLSAYGGAGSGWITLQTSGSGWFYYGVQASRSFLKNDALTVNVYARISSIRGRYMTIRPKPRGCGLHHAMIRPTCVCRLRSLFPVRFAFRRCEAYGGQA